MTEHTCSINSCKIKEQGCTDAYSGTNLSLDGLWIKGNDNVAVGWKETVCAECTDSKGATMQKDNLEFSQIDEVTQTANSCYDKMQKIGNEEKEVEFGGYREISMNDVIQNLDKQNCPMKCVVKNKGCQADYDGTNLSQTVDLKISFATTKNIEGQVSEVCFICTNIVRSMQSEIKLI